MHTHLGSSHVVIDGAFVSQEVSNVVEAIRAYSPDLDVEYVPVSARSDPTVAAYRIIHTPVGREPYVLFHIQKEADFDHRVLKRIIMADQNRRAANINDIEAYEEAQRRVDHQKFLDRMEEANDIVSHVFNSHKHTYKVSDDLVIKEGIPFNAAPKKRED